MPRPRKFPIRITVEGKAVQVRPVTGNIFQSKTHYYQVDYDRSGKLIGKMIECSYSSSATV